MDNTIYFKRDLEINLITEEKKVTSVKKENNNYLDIGNTMTEIFIG